MDKCTCVNVRSAKRCIGREMCQYGECREMCQHGECKGRCDNMGSIGRCDNMGSIGRCVCNACPGL